MVTKAQRFRQKLIESRARGAPQEEITWLLRELADASIKEGNLVLAVDSCIELNDRNRLKLLAEKCLTEDYLVDAKNAFGFLKDKEGLLRTIVKMQKFGDNSSILHNSILTYWGMKNILTVSNKFQKWAQTKGFKDAYDCELFPITNMAHNLSNNYDLGIGIAKGGLYPVYIFNAFGLKTKIAQSHKKGKDASFEWVDKITPEEISGKRILILDKDVVSGRTSRRVLEEIKKYNPSTIDLALYRNPDKKPGPQTIGSSVKNIPEGYNHFYFPLNFSYENFGKAISKLESSILI